MEVIISRGHDGKQPLTALTKFDLGFDHRRLIVETASTPAGLEAKAYVVQVSECGRFESRGFVHGKPVDYTADIRIVAGGKATVRTIRALHAEALAEAARIKEDALAFCGQAVESAELVLH